LRGASGLADVSIPLESEEHHFMHPAKAARAEATLPSLLRLAWPMFISRSSQAVVGLCDALMVAHLGKEALAATTTGAMNAFAVFILPMGTVFIVSSFVSQLFGRGDTAGARRFAFYGLGLAAMTQAACAGAIPLLDSGLGLFNFEPETFRLIRGYLAIRLLSSGAVVGIEALGNYYAGLGNTRLPMTVSLCSGALNIAGNWLLIDGRMGLPALGVAGAAWASVVAAVVPFLAFLGGFLLDGRRSPNRWPRLRLSEFLRTVRFGLPVGLNWFFEIFAFLFFVNVVVAGMGALPLAALMAVIQINSVAALPSAAVAGAGAIVVGQAIGAGATGDVPRAMRLTFLVAGGWQLAVGVACLTVPELIFTPFSRGEASGELLRMGARMLMLSVAWNVFDAAAMTLAEVLRAAGDTTYTLWMRLGLAWLVFVPGSYISINYLGHGEASAILWLVAYMALLAFALLVRFHTGAWRKIDLVGRAA
jgi:MATE family multidrug resistance protein